eukprot:scaffold377857_cov39-Attheya_sp.AAC.1
MGNIKFLNHRKSFYEKLLGTQIRLNHEDICKKRPENHPNTFFELGAIVERGSHFRHLGLGGQRP